MSRERVKALLAHIDAGDIDSAEAKAEVLWVMDQDAFWQLLTDEVVRGRHSLDVGLVLMRAVRHLRSPDMESLGRVFVRAVQRLTPEEPRRESLEFVECAQRLRDAMGEAPDPAWLVISSASAHLHHLNWLASNDEVVDLTGSVKTINSLLKEATERELLPREHLQLAATMGQYAGLTGDARWLGDARASLMVVEERYPDLAAQWTQATLIEFAKATRDEDLWNEVVDNGALLLEGPEPDNFEDLIRQKRRHELAHYHLAIAYGFLGQRVKGLSHLAKSVVLNERRMLLAASDGDMRPLLQGAGSTDYFFAPKLDKH